MYSTFLHGLTQPFILTIVIKYVASNNVEFLNNNTIELILNEPGAIDCYLLGADLSLRKFDQKLLPPVSM